MPADQEGRAVAPGPATAPATAPVAAQVAAQVAALRRPPVRQATVVRSDVGHTSDVFVRAIGGQLAEDCAPPGGYLGGSSGHGWARILACLASAIERAR